MSRPKVIRLTTIDGSLNTLLRGQLRYLDREFEMIAAADDSGRLAEVAQREGVRTVAVPMRRQISLAADIRSLWLLIRLFRREKPYIVHASTPKASLLGMVAAWITRVPHRIYYVTGLRFETTHGPMRLLLKTMERIACRCATKVVPEGEGVKATLLREGITRKPMQKVHNGNINGIDTGRFARTDEIEAQAAELRRGYGGVIFVFIGRMVRDKGINELVAAFDRLTAAGHEAKLLLVGRFEEELDPVLPETKEAILQNPRIEFAGYQTDVRPWLAASDVLVLPSYREGFPNVVLQGGAMGLPCIVTDINGCNEVITDGVNGLIVPKMDAAALEAAMERMISDPAGRAAMAAVARESVVERFRQEDVWREMLKMYKSLG